MAGARTTGLSTSALLLGMAFLLSLCGLVTFSTVSDLQQKVVLREVPSSDTRQQLHLGAAQQRQQRQQEKEGRRRDDKAELSSEDAHSGGGGGAGSLQTGDAATTGNGNSTGSRKYHVVVSTDGNHYTTWQTRIMYYWYRKARERFPDSDMGGFTRLLHSGEGDRWMTEIPTVVVGALKGGHSVDQGYPVLHRPNAFRQWLEHLDIEEDYILMAEPDHLILKPPPNWATYDRPAGYPFTYMSPSKFPTELGQFSFLSPNKQPVKDVHLNMDPLGNSPVIIHRDKLAKIVPLWTDLSLRMKKNDAVQKAFGWIQEMYAFSLAAALVEEKPIRFDMHMEFMLQPPWDPDLQVRACWPVTIIKNCPMRDAHIIHYTYGQDVEASGQFIPGKKGYWHWDKRDYVTANLPRNISTPPEGTGKAIVRLVEMINEASAALWPAQGLRPVLGPRARAARRRPG